MLASSRRGRNRRRHKSGPLTEFIRSERICSQAAGARSAQRKPGARLPAPQHQELL